MKENVGVGREKSVALEEAQARSRAQKKKMVRELVGRNYHKKRPSHAMFWVNWPGTPVLLYGHQAAPSLGLWVCRVGSVPHSSSCKSP